jgi:hypothetical protein
MAHKEVVRQKLVVGRYSVPIIIGKDGLFVWLVISGKDCRPFDLIVA